MKDDELRNCDFSHSLTCWWHIKICIKAANECTPLMVQLSHPCLIKYTHMCMLTHTWLKCLFPELISEPRVTGGIWTFFKDGRSELGAWLSIQLHHFLFTAEDQWFTGTYKWLWGELAVQQWHWHEQSSGHEDPSTMFYCRTEPI